MGGFNWKGAARAGLAYSLSELQRRGEEEREDKRAYERANREMSMDMAKLLAQNGMPIPDNLAISQEMRTLLDQYGKQLPEMEAKKAKAELSQFEEKEKIKSQYKTDSLSTWDKEMMLLQTPEGRKLLEQLYATKNPNMGLDTMLKNQQLINAQLQATNADINSKLGMMNLEEKGAKKKEQEQMASRMDKAIDDLYGDWLNVPKEYKGYYSGILTDQQIQGVDNPKVKRFLTKKKAFGLKLAKTLEGSRMSDQDRAFYLDLVLNLRMENPETAKANAESLKWFFRQMYTRGDVDPGERPPDEQPQDTGGLTTDEFNEYLNLKQDLEAR